MTDDHTQELRRLFDLQARTWAALLRLYQQGHDPRPETFEGYLADARPFVADAYEFERHVPGTFELPVLALPLVQQLNRYADFREADGDNDTAQKLRVEADDLAARHLGGAAEVEQVRTRAVEAGTAGRYHEAIIGLDAARAAFDALGDHVQAASTLVTLANTYEWLGDYERSLALADQADELVVQDLPVGGPLSMTAIRNITAEQVAALVSAGKGDEVLRTARLAAISVEILQLRARVHRWLGHYAEARVFFEQARPLLEPPIRFAIDIHLAAIAVATGDLDEADRLLAGIEPAMRHGLGRRRLAVLHQIRADVALARRRPERALADADAGLADQRDYPDLELAWKLQWRRARALHALDRTAEASAAYRNAAAFADAQRMAPLGYHLDSLFLRDKQPMIDDALRHALEAGDGEGAVWFAELVKSRALSAVLSLPRATTDAAGDDATARFDVLSAEIDALATVLTSGEGTTADLERRTQLQTERRDLLERIRIRDPRWRTMTQPAQIDVPAFGDRLARSGRRALMLYRHGDELLAAVLGAGPVVAAERTLEPETLHRIDAYLHELLEEEPDGRPFDLGAAGVRIEDLVAPAVADALHGARTLIVVPHRELHLLPWSTLTLGGRRLFEQTAVGLLPNLAALAQLDTPLAARPRLALIGDPDYSGSLYEELPELPRELDELERIYGTDGLLALPRRGAAASETGFMELLAADGADTAVLHVACHAHVEPDDPLSTALVLTRSRLDAAELVQRRCDYPEVMLSACSTGWRPQAVADVDLTGDDALGLVASFLEAGARSLLVSVTPVEDEAGYEFAVRWHRHRRGGATPLHAHQRTQQELLALWGPDDVWRWAGMTAYACR
jgi:tetratricopeptide (TPR) repeat protein